MFYGVCMHRACLDEENRWLTKQPLERVAQRTSGELSMFTTGFRMPRWFLMPILDWLATQIDQVMDPVPSLWHSCWDDQDLSQQAMVLKSEFLQSPIWMVAQAVLDERIPITDEQHIILIGQRIWINFKQKLLTALTAAFSNCFAHADWNELVSWHQMLNLSTAITILSKKKLKWVGKLQIKTLGWSLW